MSKGFVLTLDAVLAAVTALIISAAIVTIIAFGGVNYFDRLQLSNTGNDLLAVLDLSGKLSGYVDGSEIQVEEDLQDRLLLLPFQYCGNITVNIYKYQSEEFVLDKDYNAVSIGCTKDIEATKVKRLFVNTNKQKYGLVELEMWLK
jgi:hypothetical protein